MIFVKIKRESILKNPRAGETQTVIQTGVDHRFTINGTSKLPPFMDNTEVAIVTETSISSSSDGSPQEEYVKGYLLDPTKIEELIKIEGAQLNSQANLQTIRHLPEPEYLYEYENPEVLCEHCRSHVPIKNIIEDYLDNGEDEYLYEVCPICHSQNTFPDRQYEAIEQALDKEK